jgi:hypothetical protein
MLTACFVSCRLLDAICDALRVIRPFSAIRGLRIGEWSPFRLNRTQVIKKSESFRSSLSIRGLRFQKRVDSSARENKPMQTGCILFRREIYDWKLDLSKTQLAC